jgi:S-adenosylmethionine decarboxylase
MAAVTTGTEWLFDAHGCPPERLRDAAALRGLLDAIVARLALTVVGDPLWHTFGGEGGVTGLYLLAESHLTVHTYPEHGFAALNLYCCRPGLRPELSGLVAEALHAERVVVRELTRGEA